jgi:hypothetical protein
MARRLERRRRHGWGFLTELHDKGVDLFLHQQVSILRQRPAKHSLA